MDTKRTLLYVSLLIIFSIDFCFTIQTISPNQSITNSEYITSSDQIFRLGFFSPGNSRNRYIGIWYNTLPGDKVVVWVANRDKPVTDSSAVLRIHTDGNLVLLDGKQNFLWTTNVSVTASSTMAELQDAGNLVLRENRVNNTGRIIWQSFEHPSDTLLQDMKLGTNIKTGEKQVLTSWKNSSDPSEGRFRLELEPLSVPQIVVWNGSQRHWRSGPWDGKVYIGVEEMTSTYLDGYNFVPADQGGYAYVFFSYTADSLSLRYFLNPIGQIVFDKGINAREEDWAAPQTDCQNYGKCGSFGYCNTLSSAICSCLRGYEPKSTDEWSKGNWSSGCTRTTPLKCERNDSFNENGREDGFLRYRSMKVPDFADWASVNGLDECKQICIRNCSCAAYSYVSSIGCMSWHGNLLDMEMFSVDGVDLYIRVADSELDKKSRKVILLLSTVLGGVVTLGLCMFLYWRLAVKQKGKKNMEVLLRGKGTNNKEFQDPEKLKEPDVLMFRYEMLAVATDNFGLSNKLGEGGFGAVYKGKLPRGEEIAVKRLSKTSGQGTQEFKNEVAVISKLQHRNLVRLLGFCIDGEEKMLIYEYLPNKSLDYFLFDPKRKAPLGWKKRFEIIEAIGRGILYLHRDSRLRVIHRDLKPSNILLDKDLNPKIADFGMARIVGGDELQANTRRVVGTYGYMSPEYAMKGLFSEKSDVYSFGVLLEIVTGMRNTSFYRHEESLSLIEHVWKSWNTDNILEIIDSALLEPSSEKEILRCIQVGLLCVQDFAEDRPSMPSIILMLTSEITILPTPKPPAFTGILYKGRIQHKEGITVSNQKLIYMGEDLNDGRTIASYNFRDGSVIYAFFRNEETMKINVRAEPNGSITSLKVKGWYTIASSCSFFWLLDCTVLVVELAFLYLLSSSWSTDLSCLSNSRIFL